MSALEDVIRIVKNNTHHGSAGVYQAQLVKDATDELKEIRTELDEANGLIRQHATGHITLQSIRASKEWLMKHKAGDE